MARARPGSRTSTINDATAPVAALLGDDGRALLATAVGAGGGELRSATPRQTSYTPGQSVTVRYDATVRWADGSVANEMLVASTGRRLPADAFVLHDGEHEVAVWRVPHDPFLPGLAAAMDPTRTRELLGDLGAPTPAATPRLRAYRPGRRAVVEVSAEGSRLFLKVVRPRSVEALHNRHVLLSGHVPVPKSFGWSPELGLVALQAVGGRTLRAALDQRRGLPSGQDLLQLLDQLPTPDTLTGSPPGWQPRRFADLITAVAPELAERVGVLADQLTDAEAAASEPLVPVHGDFHEAQLLIDGGVISGLLDVDTFGLGRRVDDLATMIGHLATLALGSPRRAAIERYAARLLDEFDRDVDPILLRKAIAAVILGLATGPFRVLEANWRTGTARRVLLAEQWWASAQRLDTVARSA